MSDFAKVMVVAILILVGFYVVFNFAGSSGGFTGGGGYKFAPSGTDFGTTPSKGSTAVSTRASDFIVGSRDTADFTKKSIKMSPFEVSYLAGTREFAAAEVDVRRGIFKNDRNAYTFNITDEEFSKLSDSVVSGEIRNTNRYGDLRFYLNGKRVYSERPSSGDNFVAQVDKSIFENFNEFEVRAESSSWRVWAPTVYQVSFSFRSGLTGNKSQSFDFAVASNSTPATGARVTFKPLSSEGSGRLLIEVNGHQIYNETPEFGRTLTVDFPGAAINAGKNTISLGATGNAVYRLDQLNLVHYFNVQSANPVSRQFTLTDDDFDKLSGTITFDIVQVFGNPTGLVVDIVNEDGGKKRRLTLNQIDKRSYTININNETVSEGRNKAVFSLSGNGGIAIANFKVNP